MPEIKTLFLRGAAIALMITLLLSVAGCDVIPPRRPVPDELQPPAFRAPTLLATREDNAQSDELTPSAPTQDPNCTNNLTFIQDNSIPDGTQLAPGKDMVKEWKVRNSGTCNWGAGYTIQRSEGDEMGIEPSQPLEPTRNGTETVIQLAFTTPLEPGRYKSTWRAHSPNGSAFGDWFTLEFAVATP